MEDLICEFDKHSGLGVPADLPFGFTPKVKGERNGEVHSLPGRICFFFSFLGGELEEFMHDLLKLPIVE
jgi:hypothetical protein